MDFKATNKFYTFLKTNIKEEFFEEVLTKAYQYYKEANGTKNIPAEKSRNNIEFTLFLNNNYFIQIPKYDPNAWNSYYDLIPPNADYYRVTYRTRQNIIRKECWYWDGMKWCYGAEYPRPVAETCFFDIKFKPWDN